MCRRRTSASVPRSAASGIYCLSPATRQGGVMRIIALLPLCLLLSACQTAGPLDENSPFHLLPSGSRLVLKQELTIPAHSAGVLLQGGRVVSDKDLNQYHPHCRLEVHDVRATAQTGTADEFVVGRHR